MTPEAVTMEQFLAGAIENKPKTVQKFLDLGGNVNSIDEVRFSSSKVELSVYDLYFSANELPFTVRVCMGRWTVSRFWSEPRQS